MSQSIVKRLDFIIFATSKVGGVTLIANLFLSLLFPFRLHDASIEVAAIKSDFL